MNTLNYENEQKCDVLDGYVAGVNELHCKLAHITSQHRDLVSTMQRIADALRIMSNTGSR